jgi:hypothetical protein
LRWSDVQFVRMDMGIAVRLTFRFHKGYRNPQKENAPVDATRTFTLLPTRSERFEFDLSLVLFALAHERGLFVGSLEEVLAGEEYEIPVVPRVNRQAVCRPYRCLHYFTDIFQVFLSANQAGELEVDHPMQTQALNEKLNKLCVSIGLYQRNTYYSLRRSAIIETRRKHGTETAKDLALHKATGNSLLFYDNVGMGDVDINAMRLGHEAGMSRDQVRDFYSQYKTRIDMSSDSDAVFDKVNLKTSIDREVKDRLRNDEEYIAVETAHAALLDEASAKLGQLQEAGKISYSVTIPVGYTGQKSGTITRLLVQYQETELAQKIRVAIEQRHLLHKRIRHRLQKEIRERRGKEHRVTLKTNKASAKNITSQKGAQPTLVRAIGAVDFGDSTQVALDALASIPDDEEDDTDDEDADVDEDVLEELDAANARQEPESWEG